MKDIVLTFPFEDPCVVISVTGQEILDALENGVSKLPSLEGRFVQVSGIKYSFCIDSSPRIVSVAIDGKPLELEKIYSCATLGYMAEGYDGFKSLQVPKERQIVDDEQGLLPLQMLRMWFMSMKILSKWHEHNAAAGTNDDDNANKTYKNGFAKWSQKIKESFTDHNESHPNSRSEHHKHGHHNREHTDMHLKDLEIEQRILDIWQNGKTNISRSHIIAPEVEGRIIQLDLNGNVIG